MTNLSVDAQRHSAAVGDIWDLAAIVSELIRRWKSTIPVMLFTGLFAFALSYAVTPTYRAEALLMPSEDLLSQSQMAGAGGQLGGLASLVGLGGMDDRRYEAIETLKSRALTDQYVEANKLLPVLFKSRWNATSGRWKSDDPESIPTLEDAYKLFDKRLRAVTLDKKTGMITVKIEWEDPAQATQWLRDLVSLTNQKMRATELERTQRNLDYLHEELDKTSTVEIRAVIYKLIETQIKRAMLARGSDDFALRYVDPPVVPKKKIAPVRLLYLVGGCFLAFMALVIRLYVRGSRTA